MEKFCGFLSGQMGLFFPKEKWKDLEKKLLLISHSFGFKDSVSCMEWLMMKPLTIEQTIILAFHLTIGETYFFRNPALFSALEKFVLPDILLRKKKDKHLRIWCAGCCTGEEPYSIAILLRQVIGNLKDWKIEILGTDINQDFLRKAKHGCYKKWSFRATPADIINKYFIKNRDGSFTLLPEIIKMVNFFYLNLVDDVYPNIQTGICDVDLLLCQNVLIYFSRDQIEKTILQLSKTVSSKGWLSVSAIETPFINENTLQLRNFTGISFFQKDERGEVSPKKQDDSLGIELNKKDIYQEDLIPFELNLIQGIIPLKPVPEIIREVEKGLTLRDVHEKCKALFEEKQYREVITKLNCFLAPYENSQAIFTQYFPSVLLLIRTYANLGEFEIAKEWCKKALHIEKVDPLLHFYYAMIQHSLGEDDEAIHSLRHVLFLDPSFAIAHYMLGTLERKKGNTKVAQRHFSAALDSINNLSADQTIVGMDDLTAGGLKELLIPMLK